MSTDPAHPSPSFAPTGAVAPAKKRSSSWILIVAVVVAVVVVIAALWFAGVGPFAKSSNGTSTATFATFSQAREAATNAADNYHSAAWGLVLAAGLTTPTAVTEQVNSSLSSTTYFGCNVTSVPGTTLSISTMAFRGDYSQGTSSDWGFLFFSAGFSALLVSVDSGQATVVATLATTGSCGTYLGAVTSLSTNALDSPAAMSATLAAGGSTFLSAHPNSTVSYDLLGGISIPILGIARDPSWDIRMADCTGVTSSSATVPGFNATIDATTGKVVGHSSNPTSCPTSTGGSSSGTNLGSSFALVSIHDASAGSNYYYNASVATASAGLVWSDLGFQVHTSSGGTATGPVNVTVTNAAASCAVAVYGMATSTWTQPTGPGACTSGTLGPNAPVQTGASVLLLSGSSLQSQGDRWVVLGQGSFSGSVSYSIP